MVGGIVAATGHRPDKIGGYEEDVLLDLTKLARHYLKKTKPDQGISGMALGWDTAFALACIQMDVPLIAAVPFADQPIRWPYEAQKRWLSIINLASEVVIVSKGRYAPWKMHVRNQWMVDHATRLCALWNGVERGGTFECLKYAKKAVRPVDHLWSQFDAARQVVRINSHRAR